MLLPLDPNRGDYETLMERARRTRLSQYGQAARELLELIEMRAQSKLKKLAATGLMERHLLLIVRPSAFSFPVYDGLAFGGPLPGGMPILPDGLTQVWLLTGIEAGGVVRGIAGQRWTRDHPYNKPHELAG